MITKMTIHLWVSNCKCWMSILKHNRDTLGQSCWVWLIVADMRNVSTEHHTQSPHNAYKKLARFLTFNPDTSICTCSFSDIQCLVQAILCIVSSTDHYLYILSSNPLSLHNWAEQPDIQDTTAYLAHNKWYLKVKRKNDLHK